MQDSRQCICDLCPDYLWGVLASPARQIHLQCLLLLGDPFILHQCAQNEHGESEFSKKLFFWGVIEELYVFFLIIVVYIPPPSL